MPTLFIRYFFVILCTIYTYTKLNNIKIFSVKHYILHFVFVFFSAYIISSFHSSNSVIRIIVLLISAYLYLLITKRFHYKSDRTIMLISFGLSYIFLIISGIIVCFFFIYIYKTASALPYAKTDLPVGIFQFLFTCIAFYSVRFKNGITLLIKSQKADYGIYSSFFVLFFVAFFSANTNHFRSSSRILISLILTVLSVSLILYWRTHITKFYKEKLRLANEKSLESELHNKETEIEFLKEDNERLAKIIHRDNKLIPAMEQAVINYLENSYTLSLDKQRELGNSLSKQLHTMAEERYGFLNAHHSRTEPISKTGLSTIDGLLSFTKKRCIKENIICKIDIEQNISELIAQSVREEDLLHLLADLTDNAIIAALQAKTAKTIRIYLGTLQKNFFLEISDTGAAFTPQTYQHFGKEKYTTHLQDGGSGIGLIDIYSLKKKYKASLQIQEFPPNSDMYSKKISFLFDRKNHFLIQTYRREEIISALSRSDIHVFAHVSE